MDHEGLIESLCTVWDRVQIGSVANTLTEMAGFRMVDAHPGQSMQGSATCNFARISSTVASRR